MQQKDVSLLIREVPVTDVPMELLLLADPSEEQVRSYLPSSRCFIALENGIVVGACVVQPRVGNAHELMSIAVHPDHQKTGKGTALLKWIIDFFRRAGASQLEVGTGTFGYQLAYGDILAASMLQKVRQAAPRETGYGAGGLHIPVSVVDDKSFGHRIAGQLHPPSQVASEVRGKGSGGLDFHRDYVLSVLDNKIDLASGFISPVREACSAAAMADSLVQLRTIGKAIVAVEPSGGRTAPTASSAPADRCRVASRTRGN